MREAIRVQMCYGLVLVSTFLVGAACESVPAGVTSDSWSIYRAVDESFSVEYPKDWTYDEFDPADEKLSTGLNLDGPSVVFSTSDIGRGFAALALREEVPVPSPEVLVAVAGSTSYDGTPPAAVLEFFRATSRGAEGYEELKFTTTKIDGQPAADLVASIERIDEKGGTASVTVRLVMVVFDGGRRALRITATASSDTFAREAGTLDYLIKSLRFPARP